MLNIRNLTKSYGNVKAVDDLTLEIRPGEICGFIGHNGAGKTTTIKCICGILPFEKGDIQVKLNKARSEWGGTPHNDKLYRFVKSLDSLNVQLQDLEHEYNIAFMDGEDMNEVIPRLSRANQQINMRIDTLVTHSIEDNFDNILGPGIFMLVTQAQQVPQMFPWVVEIMSKASDSFKEDPYVKEYLNAANYIQNVQNGLEVAPGASPAPAPAPAQEAQPVAPTPKEMAAPADADQPAEESKAADQK